MVLGIVLGVYQGIADDLTAAETSGGVLPNHELLIEAFIPFESTPFVSSDDSQGLESISAAEARLHHPVWRRD